MAASNPTGKAILRASLRLFRQDRQMIWLPVMATITAVIAFAIIAGPVALALGRNGIALLVALACGSVVATAATVIFNVALVFAATDRIEGRTPTIRGSLAQAWGRRNVIFSWAILSAVVGTAIRLLEQRLGLVGRLIGFAGGLAWAVATFLVIPVLAFENVGPIEAVKRSSSILKARFGTIARGGLRFGLLFLGFSLGALLVILIGVVCIAKHVLRHRRPDRRSRVRPAHRRLDVRIGCRHVHANDPLSVRDGSAHSRPRRRRGGDLQEPLKGPAGNSATSPTEGVDRSHSDVRHSLTLRGLGALGRRDRRGRRYVDRGAPDSPRRGLRADRRPPKEKSSPSWARSTGASTIETMGRPRPNRGWCTDTASRRRRPAPTPGPPRRRGTSRTWWVSLCTGDLSLDKVRAWPTWPPLRPTGAAYQARECSVADLIEIARTQRCGCALRLQPGLPTKPLQPSPSTTDAACASTISAAR